MKSAIACGVSMVAMMTLHGCGSDSTPSTTASSKSSTTSAPCAPNPTATYVCPTTLSGDFLDMGDGDSKNVVLAGGVVTISQGTTWMTSFTLDPTSCRGEVNFTVPGKPDPPGSNLTFAILKSLAAEDICDSPSNSVLSFSAVGDDTYNPLNQWIQPAADAGTVQGSGFKCFPSDEIVGTKMFSDMKDGDKKNVAIDCGDGTAPTCSLKITPTDASGGEWTISAEVDKGNCSAMIDFSSKDPEAGKLQATFRVSRFHGQNIQVDLGDRPTEYFIEFVTPGSTTQVNQWVETQLTAPTTLAPTTLAPTTLAPTTLAPTTLAPTTLAPTTLAPTTLAPTTLAPTTLAPTTLAPTTTATPTTTTVPVAPVIVA